MCYYTTLLSLHWVVEMYMCEIEPIYMCRTMNINEHLRVYTKVILCKDIPMLHMCIHVEMEVDMHGSTEIVLLCCLFNPIYWWVEAVFNVES